jgi:hypothetical protein
MWQQAESQTLFALKDFLANFRSLPAVTEPPTIPKPMKPSDRPYIGAQEAAERKGRGLEECTSDPLRLAR